MLYIHGFKLKLQIVYDGMRLPDSAKVTHGFFHSLNRKILSLQYAIINLNVPFQFLATAVTDGGLKLNDAGPSAGSVLVGFVAGHYIFKVSLAMEDFNYVFVEYAWQLFKKKT